MSKHLSDKQCGEIILGLVRGVVNERDAALAQRKMPNVLRTKLVRETRKKHECWGCGEWQPRGSEMNNTTISYDGKLVSVYYCADCNPLKQA